MRKGASEHLFLSSVNLVYHASKCLAKYRNQSSLNIAAFMPRVDVKPQGKPPPRSSALAPLAGASGTTRCWWRVPQKANWGQQLMQKIGDQEKQQRHAGKSLLQPF